MLVFHQQGPRIAVMVPVRCGAVNRSLTSRLVCLGVASSITLEKLERTYVRYIERRTVNNSDLLGADAAKIIPEARFREDLDADSLDLVELIMAFEEKFGGEISDDQAQKITTVGEAVAYIDANMI